MNLYSNRTFGAIFSDSFSFYKSNFKHIFSNLFKLIWIPLLLVILSMFVLYRVADVSIKGNFDELFENLSTNSYSLLLSVAAALIFGLSALIFMVLSYSYMVVYLLLYAEKGNNFDYQEIIAGLKARAGKIIKFTLAIFLSVLGVVILLGVLVALFVSVLNFSNLALIIIMILFFFLLIAMMLIFVPYLGLSLHNAFMEYLSDTDLGLIECIGYGFRLSRSSFWKNVGSVIVMGFLINMIVGFVVAIPSYVILFGSLIMSGNMDNMESNLLLYYLVNTSLSYLMNTFSLPLIQSTMGIIYFSNVEHKEAYSSFKEIDEIGK